MAYPMPVVGIMYRACVLEDVAHHSEFTMGVFVGSQLNDEGLNKYLKEVESPLWDHVDKVGDDWSRLKTDLARLNSGRGRR